VLSNWLASFSGKNTVGPLSENMHPSGSARKERPFADRRDQVKPGRKKYDLIVSGSIQMLDLVFPDFGLRIASIWV
jgi:hypothetical protein